MKREKDWWILVGGRHRVGRGLAEALANDHHLVLTSSRNWEGEADWLAGLETEVRTCRWDAKAPDFGSQIMADLASLKAEGISPASVVVVAGGFPVQPLGAWDAKGLEDLWRLNLTFPLLVAQAVAPVVADGGSIQFLLDAAIHRPFASRLPYTASKAGLAAMVPGLAKALAPRIRVAGHALGTLLPSAASDPKVLAQATPLGRNGAIQDLVKALEFVADSPYLTGEVITLDGGWRLG